MLTQEQFNTFLRGLTELRTVCNTFNLKKPTLRIDDIQARDIEDAISQGGFCTRFRFRNDPMLLGFPVEIVPKESKWSPTVNVTPR